MSEKDKLLDNPTPSLVTPPNHPTYMVTDQPVIGIKPSVEYSSPPPDHLVWSLFSIFCCFMPLGIVALIKSVQTRQHIQFGLYAQAEMSSREARKFNKLSLWLGVAIHVATWALVFIIAAINVGLILGLAHNNTNTFE
jgi:hypothetical protein